MITLETWGRAFQEGEGMKMAAGFKLHHIEVSLTRTEGKETED